MGFELLALKIGGHPIDPSSLASATMKAAGTHWNIFVRADRDGTFDDFIMTTTGDYDCEVQVCADSLFLVGRGHVAHYGVADHAGIEVWIVGDSPLSPAPAGGPLRGQSTKAAASDLLADGWREIVD